MSQIVEKLNLIKEQKHLLKQCLQNLQVSEIPSFTEYANIFNSSFKDVNEKLNMILDVKEPYYPSLTPIQNIYCWGDSLTQGAGGSGTTYPNVLKDLISKNNKNSHIKHIYNAGFGGTNSVFSAARQGGIVPQVKPTTIKKDGQTEIEFEPYNNSVINIMTYAGGVLSPNTDGLLINECYINDICGTLSAQTDYDSNNKAIYKYFFKPIDTLESDVVLTKSTPLITYASLNATLETDLAIIWVGTNDMARADVKDWVSDIVKKMISVQNSGKYIILGLTNLNYYLDSIDKLNDYNNTFNEIFGKHFIDIKQSFVTNGINKLVEYGITPSASDNDMVIKGLISPSFRNIESDGSISKVHFNNYGYKFIGEAIYKKGIELGYWL